MTSDVLFDQWAQMSVEHRNPSDADVLAVNHLLRHLDVRAEACACCENEGGDVERMSAITCRCGR
jgi:hypothetical protein